MFRYQASLLHAAQYDLSGYGGINSLSRAKPPGVVTALSCPLTFSRSLASEILSEPADLVHALMQDCHNADVAIGQSAPVDEVVLVAEEEAVHAELGRDRA